jgi:hypothetical protein
MPFSLVTHHTYASFTNQRTSSITLLRILGLTVPTPEQLSFYDALEVSKTAVSGHERRVVTTRKIILADLRRFFF